MDKYKFLSDEWVTEARKLREQVRADVPETAESPADASEAAESATPAQTVRMNLVINEVPFGDSPVKAHLDTSSGDFEIDLGHLDDPEVTVTLDYDTAKAVLVNQDLEVGLQAFMAGKVVVEGDMSKLLNMQQGTPKPRAQAVLTALAEMTE